MPTAKSSDEIETPLILRWGVPAGDGKFHVIEGRMLNDQPLSREQAEALVEMFDITPN